MIEHLLPYLVKLEPDQRVAVDFDGTLATYKSGLFPELGEPIPEMVKLVQDIVSNGYRWELFTTRVNPNQGGISKSEDQREKLKAWIISNIGEKGWQKCTEITHEKSRRFGLIIDDRSLRATNGQILFPPLTTLPLPATTVPEILRAAASTYEQRNKLYGDNYKKIGEQLSALFPEGLMVKTPQEWNRLCLFIQAVGKMGRYARSVQSGGHKDSAHDSIVYSAMLEELTNEA